MKKQPNAEYLRLKELEELSGDYNACSVIAIAAALDITFKKAADALAAAGRKKRKGVTVPQIAKALTSLNISPFSMGPSRFVSSLGPHVNTLTVNNCVKALPKERRWLVVTRNHVVAVKNGEVIDWAKGRKFHVEEVIDVTDFID